MKPAVSILMAVHNGERHLHEALNSLLKQDFAAFELVVVDDGSTDATPAILDAAASADLRIVVLRNARKSGLPASLNRGLERCCADLTARADADDVYMPHRLSQQIGFMRANPDIGAVSCGFHRVSEAGDHLRTVVPVTDPDQIAFDALFTSRLLHPGAMFRTDLVRRLGGYDEMYWTAQDSDLWRRMGQVSRLSNMAEPLVCYRVHEKSITRTRGLDGRQLSLSVRAATLAAYLDRKVEAEVVRAMVDLYLALEPLTSSDVALGEQVMAEIRWLARQRESTEVTRNFSRAISRGLFAQARMARRDEPLSAVRLLVRSLRWRLGWVPKPTFSRGDVIANAATA